MLHLQVHAFICCRYRMSDKATILDLSRFLETLEEAEIKIKRPEREITDICEAIEEMIVSLLKNMGDMDPRFANLKDNLLKVGSFYGGTKIKEPDEFDYLVVLDDLPRDVELVEHANGFRHITMKEDSEFHDKWKDVTDAYMQMINRGITKKKRVNEVGDWHTEGKQLRSMIGEGLIEVESGIRGLFYLTLHKSFDILKTVGKITKATGYLDLGTYSSKFIMENSWYWFEQRRTEIQLHGPATNICVRWICNEKPAEPLEITADISPAFRSSNIENNIKMDSIKDKYFQDALLNHGSFLIIPTSFRCVPDGLCFNIAHTETEGKLVKDLSLVHNRSYKLLKYIMNGGNMDTVQRPADPFKLKAFMLIIKDMGIQAFECFSSFALKTVILQHSRICMDSSDVSKCITESLEHIREKLFLTLNPAVYLFQAIDVTNVFDSRQRVIGQKINKDIVLTNCLKALDDVLELLYKVTLALSFSLFLAVCKAITISKTMYVSKWPLDLKYISY